MPTIITCPSCHKQLRLPDDLLGRPVQCPTCSHYFEPGAKAVGPPLPPPPPPPPVQPTETATPQWSGGSVGVDLNLSLDNEPLPLQAPRPQPLSSPADRESAESIPPWRPAPNPVDKSEPERPRRDEPHRSDDRDQGRRPERDGDRERDGRGERGRGPDSDRDWRRDAERDRDRSRSWRDGNGRGRSYDDDAPRRDTIPHRGGTILTLGVVALALLAIGFLFPISLVLGLCAWIMGGSDLRRMKSGELDPEGQSSTMGGYVCGIIATMISVLITLICAGFIAVIFIADSQTTVTPTRPRGGLPAGTQPARKWQNQAPPVQNQKQDDDNQ